MRYTVIDNKTHRATEYSTLDWNLAWILVFLIGLFLGITIAVI